jgi:tRNA (uracil-5-)-methyltransferase TRM9
MITEETIATLEAIDERFYRESAVAFAKQREQPWPGWARVLAGWTPASVLDAGCGHGRFVEVLPESTEYIGVDRSAALLDRARAKYGDRFAQVDVVRDPLPGCHALVAAFGVLHHVPGEHRRRALIEKLLAAVAPGGRLVVTFWRFAHEERFQKKLVPWDQVGLRSEDVEPNDHLLTFDGRLRYAHHFSDEEVARLVDGLRVLDDFESDGEGGKLNRYLILG